VTNLPALTQLFFSADAPWLPSAMATTAMLHGGWAIVLGAAVYWFGAGRRAWVRWLVVLMTMALCLVPGPPSPVYWLGLMFQAPSLMSAVLCLAYVMRQGRLPSRGRAWLVLGITGLVLGGVLLLDMLAWWPVSVYAWGFSTAALALVCLVWACFWLLWWGRHDGLEVTLLLAAVVVVFVLTRLPTGNVWDAVLDPWLWLVLLVRFAMRGARRVGRRLTSRPGSPPTRA